MHRSRIDKCIWIYNCRTFCANIVFLYTVKILSFRSDCVYRDLNYTFNLIKVCQAWKIVCISYETIRQVYTVLIMQSEEYYIGSNGIRWNKHTSTRLISRTNYSNNNYYKQYCQGYNFWRVKRNKWLFFSDTTVWRLLCKEIHRV